MFTGVCKINSDLFLCFLSDATNEGRMNFKINSRTDYNVNSGSTYEYMVIHK